MALITLPKLLIKTQKVFNTWIRNRDLDGSRFRCISCGMVKDISQMDAGHYVPVKNSSALRFNEDNVHGECKGCNGFNQFHLVGYRKNLIAKIGEKKVVWLEENHREVKKWTRFELEFLINKYKL